MNAIGVATALLTFTNMSSVLFQVTKFIMYKAAEVAATTVFFNKKDTIGNMQFILMELDVEAKIKSVRSLLASIQAEALNENGGKKSVVNVCVQNIEEAMDAITATLIRIQNNMDSYIHQWFSSYRPSTFAEDLLLLKAQIMVFDKRIETLIQCMAVPIKRTDSTTHQSSLYSIRTDNINSFREGDMMEAIPASDRMKNILLAKRAHFDANSTHKTNRHMCELSNVGNSSTTVCFQDPVFL